MGPLETVEQRLDLMVDQIERAARHRRPMLIIAIYRSEFARADVEQDLRERLGERGYWVIPLEVTDPDDADLAARLAHHPAADDPQAVFFCRGLGRGFPVTLRSLNLRRELLAEQQLKAIFWVTEREAARLTREAPDFWAFRGRVVEFPEVPEKKPGWFSKIFRSTTGALKETTALLAPMPQRAPGKLVVIQGANMGKEFRLATQRIVVGRDPQFCDFALYDEFTSNPHFSIQLEQTQFFITDEGSTNGTRVNGMPILPHQRILLQPDTIIEVGQTRIQFKRLGGTTRQLSVQPEASPPPCAPETESRIAMLERLLSELPTDQEADPARAQALLSLGGAHLRIGRLDDAEKALQEALVLAQKVKDVTGQAMIWNALGDLHCARGRLQEAIDSYRQATELGTKLARPWDGLGTVYLQQGQYDEAILAYERAAELAPAHASPWTGLGHVYFSQGRYEEAIEAYHKALKSNPSYPPPLIALTHLYLQQGDIARAAEYLARARELLPPDDHYNWACLEAIAGNTDAALEHLKKAMGQAPGQRLWARRDPDLAPLHDDPRFWKLVGQPNGGNT